MTSVNVEAKATDCGRPCAIVDRAPNTIPPRWENGSRSEVASRTMRAHMNTAARGLFEAGTTTYQAMPSGTNRTS